MTDAELADLRQRVDALIADSELMTSAVPFAGRALPLLLEVSQALKEVMEATHG